jgi:hypothetical protein
MPSAKNAGLPKTQAAADLLDAINTLVATHAESVTIPYSVLNQGIADLVSANGTTIAKVSKVLTRKLDQAVTDNDNGLELVGTVILQGINAYLTENDLLLNHLAASAGILKPGDPLESVLLDQVAEAPELAYSATLLIALRDAIPRLDSVVEVLREIRDRMPPSAVRLTGESADGEQEDGETSPDAAYAEIGDLTVGVP